MPNYTESKMEFADFLFERQKVVCYGMRNKAGGDTTVLNFPSEQLACDFRETFLHDRSFGVLQNEAQLICLTDYDTLMRWPGDDPRVHFLTYSRDFMMGTLAHIA